MQCSKSCGKGVRNRQIWCRNTVRDVSVVDDYCAHLKKPKTTKQCERTNCPFVWVEGEWSQVRTYLYPLSNIILSQITVCFSIVVFLLKLQILAVLEELQ